MRSTLPWLGLAVAIFSPIVAASFSPYLQYRQPLYVMSGFAGILGLGLLLIQPLLAQGLLPYPDLRRSRQIHRLTGAALVLCVVLHIGGLWATSPPDVVDALLFRSPAPFSPWGMLAALAIVATGLLALNRRGLSYRSWRNSHMLLAAVAVIGSAAHAILVEGTMEQMTKFALCILVLLAYLRAVVPQSGNDRRSNRQEP